MSVFRRRRPRPRLVPRRDPKIARMRGVPLFDECTYEELDRLATLVDEIDVLPGQVVMHEGAPGREVFVIVDGSAVVTLRGRPLAMVGPGQVIGEMASLDHQPRSATVTAQTPMRLLVAGVLDFAALLDRSPSVRRKVLAMLSERLRVQDGSLVGGTPEHRLQ